MLWLITPPHPHPFGYRAGADHDAFVEVADGAIAQCADMISAEVRLGDSPEHPVPVASMNGALAWLETLAVQCERPLLFHCIGTVSCGLRQRRVHCIEIVSADATGWQLVFFSGAEAAAQPEALPLSQSGRTVERREIGSAACLGTWHFCPDFPLDLRTEDGRLVCREIAPWDSETHWQRPEEHALRIASLLMDAGDASALS